MTVIMWLLLIVCILVFVVCTVDVMNTNVPKGHRLINLLGAVVMFVLIMYMIQTFGGVLWRS